MTFTYNVKTVSFTQDQNELHILNIYAMDEYYNTRKIGFFNFYHKVGVLTLPEGKRKEYKQFQSLLNTFFKYDELFGWTNTPVEAAKLAGKELIKVDKKASKQEYKELWTNKALDYMNRLNNKDEQLIEVLKVSFEKLSSLTDEQLIEIIIKDFKNVITEKLAIEILNAIKNALSNLNNTEVVEEVAVTVEEEITEVNENNQTTETNNDTYIVANRTFTTYSEAEQYCLDCDFDPETMIIKEVANMQPLDTTQEPEIVEVFNVYNDTFNTYSEAYNHCITKEYPVTMIISSLHPYMNTERLQQLELEYKFSKHNMSISDMKEYYDYIMVLPISTDQEQRFYKLKSWIERYENKQIRIEEKKQYERLMAEKINDMLQDLYSIGMIKKEYEHASTTWYYLNNELIYNWSSGIPTEKMYNELTEVHNRYCKQSKAV